jgi:hypothetical protein
MISSIRYIYHSISYSTCIRCFQTISTFLSSIIPFISASSFITISYRLYQFPFSTLCLMLSVIFIIPTNTLSFLFSSSIRHYRLYTIYYAFIPPLYAISFHLFYISIDSFSLPSFRCFHSRFAHFSTIAFLIARLSIDFISGK